MKIFKNKFDKWETTGHFTTPSGSQVKNYIEIGFKKGFEPVGKEIEGELIFREEDGTERPCFFSGYQKKDGTTVTKLIVMHPSLFGDGKKEEKQVQTSLTGTRETVDGHIDSELIANDDELIIEDKDLPFY